MNFQRLLTTGLLLACFGLMGQNAPPPAPANSPVAGDAIPKAVDNRTYKMGPQDVVRINVYEMPSLTGNYPIEPDGMISLPLLDPIKADGLTPEELKVIVKEAWSAQVKSPEISIAVIDVRSKTYRVTGMVNKPSTFPLVQPIHVYEAISDAGGFREYANEKKILIIRGTQRIYFNAKDYRNGKNLDKNILVENNDIIEVR